MASQKSLNLSSPVQDRRKQLLQRVASLIEDVKRRGRVLSADPATDQLIAEYPNCPMSRTELRQTIVRLAAEADVSSTGAPQKPAKRR
jgi:hypothetical protein